MRATAQPLPCPLCLGSGSTALGALRRACCGPGRRSRLAVEPCEDVQIRWTTLAMASIATTALDQAVLEPGRSRAFALATTAGVLVVPAIVTAWYFGAARSLGRWTVQPGSIARELGHDRRPRDAVRSPFRERGRVTPRERPVCDGGSDLDVGLAEPGARPGRDGLPAGLCEAVGGGQPVPGDGGLRGRRRGRVWPSSRRSGASRSPGRSG